MHEVTTKTTNPKHKHQLDLCVLLLSQSTNLQECTVPHTKFAPKSSSLLSQRDLQVLFKDSLRDPSSALGYSSLRNTLDH